MALVGFNNLQGRSAYQPIMQQQSGRFIAYIDHHAGFTRNPLNGKTEPNGTPIVDVTDSQHPRYIRDYGVVGQEPGSSGEPVPAPIFHSCPPAEREAQPPSYPPLPRSTVPWT
jgi:hypothetical protein